MIATCHTSGCTNADQPIDLSGLLDDADELPPVVTCGVCGHTIVDVA